MKILSTLYYASDYHSLIIETPLYNNVKSKDTIQAQ